MQPRLFANPPINTIKTKDAALSEALKKYFMCYRENASALVGSAYSAPNFDGEYLSYEEKQRRIYIAKQMKLEQASPLINFLVDARSKNLISFDYQRNFKELNRQHNDYNIFIEKLYTLVVSLAKEIQMKQLNRGIEEFVEILKELQRALEDQIEFVNVHEKHKAIARNDNDVTWFKILGIQYFRSFSTSLPQEEEKNFDTQYVSDNAFPLDQALKDFIDFYRKNISNVISMEYSAPDFDGEYLSYQHKESRINAKKHISFIHAKPLRNFLLQTSRDFLCFDSNGNFIGVDTKKEGISNFMEKLLQLVNSLKSEFLQKPRILDQDFRSRFIEVLDPLKKDLELIVGVYENTDTDKNADLYSNVFRF